MIALPLTVEREEVLHFLGYPRGHQVSSRLESLLDRTEAEARSLADARGVFVSLPVERAADVGLEAIDDATGLIVGLVTIGDAIERRAATLMNDSPTQALLLDAAGSAAVEEAANRLSAVIAGHDSDEVPQVSCRVSPGYGRWPLHSQRSLFALLPHDDIGVTLLPSMLMAPRKSISFAMWLGARARPIAGLSGCAHCGMKQCRYRKES